jgi:hypothetical protein
VIAQCDRVETGVERVEGRGGVETLVEAWPSAV